MTITLDQLTLQNTPFTTTVNYSEGFPLGVPTATVGIPVTMVEVILCRVTSPR